MSSTDVTRASGLKEMKEAKKIPVDIFFKQNGSYLFFNAFLSNVDVLTVHLLKSDEYIFGLYNGSTLSGFLYLGDKLDEKSQSRCFQSFLPKNYNDLDFLVQEYKGRIDYYPSHNDQFKVVGEINEKEVIQRLKANDSNKKSTTRH